MRRLYGWLKSYFSLSRMISKCGKRSKRLRKDLEQKKKELFVLEKRFRKLSEAMSEDIQEAGKLADKSDMVLEAIQSRLTVAEDVTIPALVQANKLLLERASADTAEQVRRQIDAQQPSKRTEEYS